MKLFVAWTALTGLFLLWIAAVPCHTRADISDTVLGWLVKDDRANCD